MSKKEINPYLKVNPVYHTKEPELYNLVRANVEEAATLNNYLKFFIDSYRDGILKAQALFQEVRYRFINYYIDLHKDETILDLGCGFSPRGLKYAKEGRGYLGFDLENCIEQLIPAVKASLPDDKQDFAKYTSCDVCNIVTFKQICEQVKNPLILVCEGLLMYFNKYDLDCFCEGLKEELKTHGGRFITLDYSINKLMKVCFDNLAGRFLTFKMIRESKRTQQKYSGFSKDEMDPSKWFSTDDNGDTYAEQYFLSHGLSIKRIPIYNENIKLNVLDTLDPKVKNKIIDKLKRLSGWEVTLEDANVARLHKTDSISSLVFEKQKFQILDSVVGDTLIYNINGHLDSITAVNLLENFERYNNLPSLRIVDIDANKLEYISSAGLRVLLIMKKKNNINKVIIRHPCELVKDIILNSGFDSVVEMED